MDTFNEYFETIVRYLDLHYWKDNSELLSNTKFVDRINNIMKNKKMIQTWKTSKNNLKFWEFFFPSCFIRRGEKSYPRFKK